MALLVGAAGLAVIHAFTDFGMPFVLRVMGISAFGNFTLCLETLAVGFALLFAVSLLMVFRHVISSPRGRVAGDSAAPSTVEGSAVPS
jgi:hypothetical protein